LDLSYLYSKLVQTYSSDLDNSVSNTPDESPDTSDTEEAALLPKSIKKSHPHFTPGAKNFMAMYGYFHDNV